ncbi:MAG: hypothetical protein C4293_22430 [Nitrospiraceae bacterium]
MHPASSFLCGLLEGCMILRTPIDPRCAISLDSDSFKAETIIRKPAIIPATAIEPSITELIRFIFIFHLFLESFSENRNFRLA